MLQLSSAWTSTPYEYVEKLETNWFAKNHNLVDRGVLNNGEWQEALWRIISFSVKSCCQQTSHSQYHHHLHFNQDIPAESRLVSFLPQHVPPVLPGGVMVKALDLQLKGRRFDLRPFRFQVTTSGKLFTHVPHLLCYASMGSTLTLCSLQPDYTNKICLRRYEVKTTKCIWQSSIHQHVVDEQTYIQQIKREKRL